jgi:hypothetical protein
MVKRSKLLYLIFIIFFTACTVKSAYHQIPPMPPLILWAWEAPQHLTDIDPNTTGVAVLVASIRITPERLIVHPRQQPIVLPSHTYTIAVVHIDKPPVQVGLDATLVNYLADRIGAIYRQSKYQQLQIDFDTLPKEEGFYRDLLLALRQRLGEHAVISITAIASWCTNNRWLDKQQLPINYVVPMFFNLDQDEQRRKDFIKHVPRQRQQLADYCQGPVGLATYESWQVPFITSDSVFVYTEGSWDAAKLSKAQGLQKSHYKSF